MRYLAVVNVLTLCISPLFYTSQYLGNYSRQNPCAVAITTAAQENDTYVLTSWNSSWDNACFSNGSAVIDGIQFYPMKLPLNLNLSSIIGGVRVWFGYYQIFTYFNILGCLPSGGDHNSSIIGNTPGRCAMACSNFSYIGLEDNMCHCLNLISIRSTQFMKSATCSMIMCNGTNFICGTSGHLWVYGVNIGNTSHFDEVAKKSDNANKCVSVHYRAHYNGAAWNFTNCLDHQNSLCGLNGFEQSQDGQITCLSLSVTDGQSKFHFEDCQNKLPSVCLAGITSRTRTLTSTTTTTEAATGGKITAIESTTSSPDKTAISSTIVSSLPTTPTSSVTHSSDTMKHSASVAQLTTIGTSLSSVPKFQAMETEFANNEIPIFGWIGIGILVILVLFVIIILRCKRMGSFKIVKKGPLSIQTQTDRLNNIDMLLIGTSLSEIDEREASDIEYESNCTKYATTQGPICHNHVN